NGRPVRENSIALRYITDPTQSSADKEDCTGHEYMNQSMSETSRSSRLSDVLNPNYEDLSQGWGATSFPSPLGDPKPFARVPDGPEYLNTAQSSLPLAASDSLDNPDYQADFLPQAPPPSVNNTTLTRNGLFLPTAENLEYLGLGAALHAPVR
ncbi:melanoma receptor tyrosine-protein kinase, partial [Notolabrus celidotus]|uniref:melanoma receptor tyrosine-protein kinase n=1 Tax=Notolabrus celidotus TaxID=1203425 RepID=UPI00148F900F